jgi:hypothetical protein
MKPPYYILVDKTPVGCFDLMKWGRFMSDHDRVVAVEQVGDATVSTIFLGMDHSFSADPKATPVVFETMIFQGPRDQEMHRYCTWDEAEAGHHKLVAELRGALQ